MNAIRMSTGRGSGLLAAVLLAGLAAGCVPPTPVDPGPVLPDLGGREVKVAVFADQLPYSRVNPITGDVEGWDHDLITAMAEQLNFAPRFIVADPESIRDDLAAGRFDIVGGGIAYTLARDEVADFAAAYDLVKERIAVRAGETRASTVAEFHDDAGLRAGAVLDTTSHDHAVRYLGSARVEDFESVTVAMDALAAGTIDGVVLDDVDLQREKQRRPGVFASLSGPVAADVLAYALPKGSDLVVPINTAYQVLLTDGTVANLRSKWGL